MLSGRRRKSAEVALSDFPLPDATSFSSGTAAKPLLSEEGNTSRAWPSTPKPIKTRPAVFSFNLFIDCLLLTLSVGFLAFALAVVRYDQAAVEKHARATDVLVSLSKVGPSIFPILFAAVISRTTHAILLWRLEKGEKIGVLDLLAGSTSLTSTVNSQLHLRIFSVVGLVLVLVWSLSPLGGQASIRQLGFGNGTYQEPVNLAYLLQSSTGDTYGDTSRQSNLNIANAIFISALFSPAATRNSSVDLWGNVKIPSLEVYENATTADSDGWYTTNSSETLYASLIGVPITGYVPSANISYTYNMETSYFRLECPVINQTQDDSKLTGSSFYGPGAWISLGYNASCGVNGTVTPPQVDPYCTLPDDTNTTARNFTYVDYGGNTGGATGVSFCTITTTWVEVDVDCPPTSACRATRLRRSMSDHLPSTRTVFDDNGGFGYSTANGNWGFFLYYFINVIAGHPATSTPLQKYLVNPDEATTEYGSSMSNINDSGNGGPAFNEKLYAIRQGQLMNAFWTSLTDYNSITGGSNTSTGQFQNLLANQRPDNTTGTKTTYFKVIACNRGWSGALAFASTVLVIACLVHPILRSLLNRTPDLMLNISSLATRDNAYVDVPEGGTGMDASKRARLMRDMKVRFGDVDAEDNFGKLAIASLGTEGSHRVAKVRKGRLYR